MLRNGLAAKANDALLPEPVMTMIWDAHTSLGLNVLLSVNGVKVQLINIRQRSTWHSTCSSKPSHPLSLDPTSMVKQTQQNQNTSQVWSATESNPWRIQVQGLVTKQNGTWGTWGSMSEYAVNMFIKLYINKGIVRCISNDAIYFGNMYTE